MRLESVGAFSALVRKAKADHPKVSTNCYLMPNDIADFCLQNRMQYVLLDAGVYFLCDMGHFYRMYYYFDPSMAIGTIQPMGKPVVIEFVTANGRIRPEDEAVEQRLADAGFSLNTKSLRAQRTTGALPYAAPEGFVLRLATDADADAIYALWMQAFDPVRNLLPSREELASAVRQGEVVCTVSEAGRLAGVLQASFGRGVCTAWHGLVDDAFRGRGIYWPMFHMQYALAAERGITRHQMWIEEDNLRMQDIALGHGYAYDGVQSRQYVLK